MAKIVITNAVGRLASGRHLVLFPSRCDWVGDFHPFSYSPYELAYLSALLKRELPQHEIHLVDPNLHQMDPDQTVQLIEAFEPDVLVAECAHLTYPAMTGVMREIKKSRFVYAILTGPYGTSFPKEAYRDGWDAVIPGEYEVKVLGHLLNGEPEPGYVDLDRLPFPEDHDINRIFYSECSNPYPGMVQVYASRGCAFGCTYCTAPLYYGGHGRSFHAWRGRDPEKVCDEIEYLAGRYPQFTGAFFNEEDHSSNPRWLASLADTITRRGLARYHYEAMCSSHRLSGPLIEKLGRAGYCQLRIGCESLDPGVGAAIHKRTFPQKFTGVLSACKASGIRTYITVMVGAPGSSWEADLATLEALADLKAKGLLDVVQHSTATPNPGTPFYYQALREGWLVETDVSRYNWKSPVVNYPNYSAEEIGRMNQMYYSLRVQ